MRACGFTETLRRAAQREGVDFVEICIAIGFINFCGAKRRVTASMFSACMWWRHFFAFFDALLPCSVRACGFTETLRRAAQREGVGMTACHVLGR